MLKGHLGQKSSPLAPTSCKLSKQMLVLQHMNSHYKKLSTVKSAIDMSCPKTVATSVKSRDQARRRGGAVHRPGSRPSSSRPASRVSSDNDHFSSTQAFADDPIVDQIVRDAHGQPEQQTPPSPSSRLQTSSKWKGPPRQLWSPLSPYAINSGPDSVRRELYEGSSTNRSTNHSTRRPSSAGGSVRVWPSADDAGSQRSQAELPPEGGDILDCHAKKFTEARPFTPRTLRRNTPSKISQSRFYNRPKPRPKARPGNEKNNGPRADPKVAWDATGGDRNTRMEMNDGREGGQVPPLPLDMDPDKLRWLKEQAERAQLLQNTSARSHDTPYFETQNRTTDFDRTQPDNELMLSGTMQRVQEEEEELKYLEFYSDVTADVLNRGIFTNKVLNQVFQHHMEKNKHNLRLSKMHEILGNIRRELGIPENENLDDSFGYGAVRSNLELASGYTRDDSGQLTLATADSGNAGTSGYEASFVNTTHRPLTDNDIMRFRIQARETERQFSDGVESDLNIVDVSEKTALEFEESHLSSYMPETRPSHVTSTNGLEEARDIAPVVEDRKDEERRTAILDRSVSVPSTIAEEKDGDNDLLNTQDEVELTLLQDTLRRTYDMAESDKIAEEEEEKERKPEVPEHDEIDAAAERKEYEEADWSRKLDERGESRVEVADVVEEHKEVRPVPKRTRRHIRTAEKHSDQIDNGPDTSMRPPDLMTMTLRPGMFDTMLLQTSVAHGSDDETTSTSQPQPASRGRLGKTVTFASQDEVLMATRESDDNGATLTEVSAASSLDMSSMKKNLPSERASTGSTDYDDDFEDDDDGF